MKVCKDVTSGHELGSDSIPYTEIDDMFVRFKVKLVDKEHDQGEYDIGANPSADDEEQSGEQTSTSVEQVLNIVDNHKLETTQFPTKKSFKLYLKDYLKELMPNLSAERKKFLKENMERLTETHILSDFENCQFFIGESFSGCVGIVREIDNEKYMFFMKDGIFWEKF